jgi:inorganic pyrophosphatase
MEFDVVIEIPRGSRNKYEVDHESGLIRLDRTLFTATQHPADYGFVPDTLGEDGDPRQEHLQDLHHLPRFDRLEIEHFFLIYKQLEPGKSVEGASWADRGAAEAEVETSRQRLRENRLRDTGSDTTARSEK